MASSLKIVIKIFMCTISRFPIKIKYERPLKPNDGHHDSRLFLKKYELFRNPNMVFLLKLSALTQENVEIILNYQLRNQVKKK